MRWPPGARPSCAPTSTRPRRRRRRPSALNVRARGARGAGRPPSLPPQRGRPGRGRCSGDRRGGYTRRPAHPRQQCRRRHDRPYSDMTAEDWTFIRSDQSRRRGQLLLRLHPAHAGVAPGPGGQRLLGAGLHPHRQGIRTAPPRRRYSNSPSACGRTGQRQGVGVTAICPGFINTPIAVHPFHRRPGRPQGAGAARPGLHARSTPPTRWERPWSRAISTTEPSSRSASNRSSAGTPTASLPLSPSSSFWPASAVVDSPHNGETCSSLRHLSASSSWAAWLLPRSWCPRLPARPIRPVNHRDGDSQITGGRSDPP